ncbi:DUF1189 family protein [Candidatus Izemoplasma sp. B36]|uniref:DUF1189 family protein n=1 Tax=Candidatus Izemoplasma sp. B36 TaxID=3242468 RepID=UPI0035591910
MFNIFKDSLFDPKGLVKYVNKKGFFVFIYYIILAIFMSAGPIVNIAKQVNSTFSEENTGCSIVNESVVCSGDNYDIDNVFYLSGFRVFFLNESDTIDVIDDLGLQSVVIQGKSLSIYFGDTNYYQFDFFDLYDVESIEEGMDSLASFFLIGGIAGVVIQNIVLLLVVVLISSLAFLRFRKEIRYRKIFKLVIFAVTPLAVLFTFYGLFDINEIVFFILMFIAYRPIFTLQREILSRSAIRNYNKQHEQEPNNGDDVVESYKYDEVETEDVEDSDDELD